MPSDVDQVVAQLRAAYEAGPDEAQSTLVSLYADKVDMRHVPALPSDGIVDGAKFREGTGKEAAVASRGLPDMSHEDLRFTVDGTSVHFEANVCGTLPSGETVKIPTDMLLEIGDGRIVMIEHRLKPEAVAGWTKVLSAGGVELPREIIEKLSP